MYHEGEGVDQSLTIAHMWTNLAGANGVEDAREARERLERAMSDAEIRRAQQLARKCHESRYRECPE